MLVVRGEPGIGKTALLEYAIDSASGFEVTRSTGIESEMELPFAGLHQLCSPMLDMVDLLPDPQRVALSTVFGMTAGRAPDRFLVGLGLLGLLYEASKKGPLLCAIDDAQWLDRESAHALGFATRRLLADPVLVIVATRWPSDDFDGLHQILLESLDDVDSHTLLESVLRAPIDEQVRERIIAETHGNPLALVEWPRGLSPAELAGGFGLPALLPVSGQIEESFRRRLAVLPAPTQRFLTVAAAEPIGDPVLLWQAAHLLGIAPPNASPAVEADLIELGTKVRFRHPSARSAAYRMAATDDRCAAHRALADVTDPTADPDRRAWHRALATQGPDEKVAAELEHSANRAQSRGGLAASAALLERSVMLTLDPVRRAQRSLAAAAAYLEAGALESASALLGAAEAGPLDDFGRAQVELLRGYYATAWGNSGHVADPLMSAAKRLEPIDIPLSRRTYVAAMGAAVTSSGLAGGLRLEEVAQVARKAPSRPKPATPHDILLDALATAATDGPAAAAPALREANRLFRDVEVSPEEGVRWLGYVCASASLVWDWDTLEALAARQVDQAREVGALTMLPLALNTLAVARLLEGDLVVAASLIDEAAVITDVTRSNFVMYASSQLASWRGCEAEATAIIDGSIKRATAQGQGLAVQFSRSSAASLYNGLGLYEKAVDATQDLLWDPPNWAPYLGAQELVESASRTGQVALASDALSRLAETTGPAGTDWAIGIEARSRALLTPGEKAEPLYKKAIDHLERSRVRPEAARARLLYGEWLRREGRRVDARKQLRIAHERLGAMGIEAFAERARRELVATGETVRKRTVETLIDLTPQEVQIARLAADGRTNIEIGSQLFISPRTVEWHLRKVFTKLSVNSRRELRGALPRLGSLVSPG